MAAVGSTMWDYVGVMMTLTRAMVCWFDGFVFLGDVFAA